MYDIYYILRKAFILFCTKYCFVKLNSLLLFASYSSTLELAIKKNYMGI